ncbi:nuclear transport factor 2 family protein [soil metagenome]
MKNLLLAFLIILIGSMVTFGQSKEEKAKVAIRKVMDEQVLAWNRGDVEGFMQGYWKSETLVFVSGDNVRRGWQTVTDNYKKSYNTREEMGILSFSDLEITVLSKDSASVLGSWKVQAKPNDSQGKFTLLFRKFKDGWRIIQDHTS